jgi:hypothetical protein
MATDEVKKKVMKHYVEIIKQADEHRVLTYEKHFFKASDLQYLSAADAKLATAHLVSQLGDKVSLELLEVMEGLGATLDGEDISKITDAVLRAALYGDSTKLKTSARKYLSALWMKLPHDPNADGRLVSRLDDWIAHFEKQSREDLAQAVRDIKEEAEEQPPF